MARLDRVLLLDCSRTSETSLASFNDGAQGRGEVAKNGDNLPSVPKHNSKPTAADVGLPRKQIHNAPAVRDADSNHLSRSARAIASSIAPTWPLKSSL